jgi:excisionase family DNA binding protein
MLTPVHGPPTPHEAALAADAPAIPPQVEYMTAEEAAVHLGMQMRGFRRLVARGELSHAAFRGKRYLFDPVVVEALRTQRQAEPDTTPVLTRVERLEREMAALLRRLSVLDAAVAVSSVETYPLDTAAARELYHRAVEDHGRTDLTPDEVGMWLAAIDVLVIEDIHTLREALPMVARPWEALTDLCVHLGTWYPQQRGRVQLTQRRVQATLLGYLSAHRAERLLDSEAQRVLRSDPVSRLLATERVNRSAARRPSGR